MRSPGTHKVPRWPALGGRLWSKYLPVTRAACAALAHTTTNTKGRVLAVSEGVSLVEVTTTTTGASRLFAVAADLTVKALGHGRPTETGLRSRKRFPAKLLAAFNARWAHPNT
jgi:hypothetical protein